MDSRQTHGARAVQLGIQFRFVFVAAILASLASQLCPEALARSDGRFPGKGSYNAWTNANTLMGFGNKSASEGNLDKALDYYKKAIHTYGFDSSYYLNLGNALAMKNDFHLAEQAFAKAAELEPGYYQAWLNMAHMSMKLQKPDDAISAFKHAARLTKDKHEREGIEKQIESLKQQERPAKEKKKKRKEK